MNIKSDSVFYANYLNALIKKSSESINNKLGCPIILDNFMIATRRKLLNERNYKDLASLYELLGMHCRNINNLFFNNYPTYNYYTNSLLKISCYYYRHVNTEYANSLAQFILTSQKKAIREYNKNDIRITGVFAMNVELIGDIYLLLNPDISNEYYHEAQQIFKEVNYYEQLSYINEPWYSYVITEENIALQECFNINIKLKDTGIERIQQKMICLKKI